MKLCAAKRSARRRFNAEVERDLRISQNPALHSHISADDGSHTASRATGDLAEVEQVGGNCPLLARAGKREGDGKVGSAGIGVVARSIDGRVGHGCPEGSGRRSRSLFAERVKRRLDLEESKLLTTMTDVPLSMMALRFDTAAPLMLAVEATTQ